MRYRYCPKCDLLRVQTIMMEDRCDACRGDTIPVTVPRSVYGTGMHLAVLVAGGMLLLYLAHRDLDAGFASFLSEVDETLYLAVMFGVIFLSFVLAFIDRGRTERDARRVIEERKERTEV